MSRITSVVLVTYTLTSPLAPQPAGTMAASALTRPSTEFMVETTGWYSPVGQMVRYPSGPCGTTVTFSEYAAASVGILQPPACGMGKLWKVPPLLEPLPPCCGRVSTNRQGVTATNCRACEKMASTDKGCVIVTVQEDRSEERRV